MKNKTTMIVLCCLGFIGLGGIHDFYIGRPLRALVKLFTINWLGIGTIIDLIKISKETYDIETQSNTRASTVNYTIAKGDIYDKLSKLKDLLDTNVITQEEFEDEKKKLLNK